MITNREQTMQGRSFSPVTDVLWFWGGGGEEGTTYEFKNINNNTYLHIMCTEKKRGLRLFRLIYIFEKTKSPEWKRTS